MKIQLDLPKELNKKVKLYSIENDINDMRIAVIDIIDKFFLECSRRKFKMNLSLSVAEMVTIEDFAMCDLQAMIDEKPKEVELMQDIMKKVMHKVFKEESRLEKN